MVRNVSTLSVLLHQNNSSTLKEYTMELEGNGCRVTVAKNERDAVKKYAEIRPDILLVDFNPANDVSMVDAIAKIIGRRCDAKIIMTAPSKAVTKAMERIGVDIFLERPFSTETLLDSVMALSELKPVNYSVTV